MPKWFEYKIVNYGLITNVTGLDDILNTYGREGWELVSVVPLSGGVFYHFKREVRNA